jgi:hypothetical protein
MDDEKQHSDAAENAWKLSIAASLSSATVSASAKSDTQGATAGSDKSSSSSIDQAVAWEAQGGNTTLASNSGAWCSTVESYTYWRVVAQEVVLPLEQVIASIEGYHWVLSTFPKIVARSNGTGSHTEVRWYNIPELQNVSVGSGIRSSGGLGMLKPSPFTKLTPTTVSVGVPKKLQWTVLCNDADLSSYLEDLFCATISRIVGTTLFPNQVWRLAVSDRAFTVILKLTDALSTTSATVFTKGSIPPPKTNADPDFGDRYVDAITTMALFSVPA